ncbi:hypothetical protein D9757_006844 [Collybiopsis confluens]|uniref:LysM domain-containing protein n=1 Tax=Collybiopsis confluens TaxID=2823264 RepID=A0A8H5HPN4_9AGAR|nr:hypothetical protein D9757_006844 [Collybiopsis confluens]
MFAQLALLTLVLGAIGANAQSCSGPPYTVISGDTCANIAAKLSTTFQELEACNPSINADCTNLAIGQVLQTPGASSGGGGGGSGGCGACVQSYTVEPGDFCAKIAAEFGITLAQLQCANPQINAACTNLAIGASLCIPAA